MFTRCVSSRMCSPCSRHSTGTIGASRGRRQSCNTSGRRCCWRRRSTLTSIGCEEARTRQVLDVYSSRFALVGCESTPRRRHRVSLPGTISANFASTLVFWFRVRFFQVLQFKLMLLLQFFLLVYINWFMTKSFWLLLRLYTAQEVWDTRSRPAGQAHPLQWVRWQKQIASGTLSRHPSVLHGHST